MAIALARALAVGSAGGALCAWIGTPLPWLIGSLFCCAVLRLRGVRLGAPVTVRNAGQWVIGTTLGLYFAPDVVARLVPWAPWIALAVGWALLVGMANAWALARWGGADPATAWFAGAIGGASEMAVQGERAGASAELVAAAHGVRLMLVVSTIPFAYQALGLHGLDAYEPVARAVSWPGLAGLVVATSAGAWVLRRLGAPNAWVLGPMGVAAVLAATGAATTAMPGWLVAAGQVLIGISLGERFAPGFFARAPRLLATMAAATAVGVLASAAFGAALGALSGIPVATMVLATSPGGIAEMSLTAKVLKLGVPVVSAFHVVRMAFMVLMAMPLWRLVGRRVTGGASR